VDRIKYGYDRNGNRTYRENTVATAGGVYFDEKYVHDQIDRLKSMERGALDSGHSTLDHLQFAQRWGLDASGNWRSFLEDSDGDSNWDLDQTRTANEVNEIADITESAGPPWVTPVYNRVGNMTTIPKPADPTQSFTATYDAWNRLVSIEEGGTKLAECEYDGAKRRTVNKKYVSGQLHETRHFFCTAPSKWQVIEERVGTSTGADRQFVWGVRYVDDLILRDRDTDSDESLDERLYGVQDANWNVGTLVDGTGNVVERHLYTAYGAARVCSPTWGSPTAPTSDGPFYCGCFLDPETELYRIRNRYYNSTLSSFVARDPIGYGGMDFNLYRYVTNRPTTSVDPTGLVCGLPDSFSDAWLIRHILTLSSDGLKKLRKCLKKHPKLWQRLITAEKFAKVRNRQKRGGKICGRLLKYLFLIECEAACAAWYKSCLDDAKESHEACLKSATSDETIEFCNTMFSLDATECATWYAVCGLGCLLPIDPPEPP
jgi:RHS repeat-associated protein